MMSPVFVLSLALPIFLGLGSDKKSQSKKKASSVSQEEVGEALETGKPQKFYFSDLQIVDDVKTDGICIEPKKNQHRYVEDFKVELSEDKKLIRKLGKNSLQYYALNIVFQSSGLDQIHTEFSAMDGVLPEQSPYGLRIRRKPGNFIELYFLDQVYKLQLTAAPVYSFQATEQRGSCKVIHEINIFAENNGYYEAIDP